MQLAPKPVCFYIKKAEPSLLQYKYMLPTSTTVTEALVQWLMGYYVSKKMVWYTSNCS